MDASVLAQEQEVLHLTHLRQKCMRTSWKKEVIVSSGPCQMQHLRVAHALSVIFPNAGDQMAMLYLTYCHVRSVKIDTAASEQQRSDLIKAQLWKYRSEPCHYTAYDDSTDADTPTGFAAHDWLSEWKTFAWLLRMNYVGVNPSGRDLSTKWLHEFPQAARGLLWEFWFNRLSTTSDAVYCWTQKFKQHWRLNYKVLPSVGNAYNPTIIEQKAGCHSCWHCYVVLVFGFNASFATKTGTTSGYQIKHSLLPNAHVHSMCMLEVDVICGVHFWFAFANW